MRNLPKLPGTIDQTGGRPRGCSGAVAGYGANVAFRKVMHYLIRVIAVVLVSRTAVASGLSVRAEPIDRQALVTRHNVVLTTYDGARPLSVGNGEFAFNMDITGLQTFTPFNTMSQWGWHSGATPAGTKLSDYRPPLVDVHGRLVPHPLPDPAQPELSAWMASSPHRINLGRIGLALTLKDGRPATEADMRHPKQELDLWRGIVSSRFEIEGVPVAVETSCHPTLDAIAVRIESPLIREKRLAVFLACPGNNPVSFAQFVGDWSSPGRFEPVGVRTATRADFRRQMDEHLSYVSIAWSGEALIQDVEMRVPSFRIVRAEYGARDQWLDVTRKVADRAREGIVAVRVDNSLGSDPIPGVPKSLRVTYQVGDSEREASAAENADLIIDAAPSRHRVTVVPDAGSDRLDFVCAFSPSPLPLDLPDAEETMRAAEAHWADYWRSGGAIDLSASTDPRWRELERRIVLSQYLMAVHEAGSLPPQESGLVNNGWYGRFHLEMVWWHAAHWALWDRWPQLRRSIGIYDRLLADAKGLAKSQGYQGARWPKCVGPDGGEWPHEIHAFLIWQQPHPIFFAELDYRAHPTRETLERWGPIVEATAAFMASYAHAEPDGRYVLGPPIHLVSENTPPLTTQNPTFELGYWRFGLRVAQEWRARMEMPVQEDWNRVVSGLAPLPVEDGCYVLHEGVQDMWTRWNFEHPALIGAFGMLPGDGVDHATMKRTLARVTSTWNFNRTWGWDFPMLAMTAARLGDPELAIDYLLHPSPGFQFDERGLATGGPFPYFPSNGGLLYAAAMMAGGWEGAPPGRHAPGFPANGRWKVRYENIRAAP